MPPRAAFFLLAACWLAGCTLEVPLSALRPLPKSGLWELKHQGDGSVEEIVLEFERGGNLKVWDAPSVKADRAYRDPEQTLDPKLRRWNADTGKVEFLHCPPGGGFCGFYTLSLVGVDKLEGYMVMLPPDGEKIHRVDYTAAYKSAKLPTRYRPTPTPEPTPTPSPKATATPKSSSSEAPLVTPSSAAGGSPDLIILSR